ncbi:MAG: hypothetical protein ABJK37_18475 [Paraglaciecola sp.]|uniref:hypothetical protein n=1 Tax=Paraglaciecola sp. TaxID=1920173 RepID=UPI0032991854
MYQHAGKCDCGNVTIEFSSSKNLPSYNTRICDCVYCTSHGIEYLSDPDAQISFVSNTPLKHQKQGSQQASFLKCSKCQTVIGVCYIDTEVCVGTLNAKLLDKFHQVQQGVVVSPKRLNKAEKVKRWRQLWSPIHINITA